MKSTASRDNLTRWIIVKVCTSYSLLFVCALIVSKVLTISPLRSALPIQDLNIDKANGIGGIIVYFLNMQDGSNLICRMNIQTTEILRIF